MTTRITVLGAGAFGTALAIQLARRENPTLLWGRNTTALAVMREKRFNERYLPGCHFPPALQVETDLTRAVAQADHILVATPSHSLRAVLEAIRPALRDNQGIACACKGLEPATGLLPHQVAQAVLESGRPFAVVSGPTFAKELGLGLPTAITVASSDAAFARTIAEALHGDGFRAYTTDDVTGVEIGGAAKNVLAIGIGIADGLGLGANTRAALIARGLSELMRLAEALGARAETLMGLSGLGDVVLTCTDDQSRNRRMGLMVGRGTPPAEAIAAIGTVEGARAAPEVLRIARAHHVETPLVEQVARVLAGETTPVDAVRALAMRPVKPEVRQ
ncbi:MAG TPA: NAD(P)H-dependent glycerol-3-phosphate dehydrogenase [Nevskiaceae bacterium]|nr:NAD(P)H-dependent glycerol-3-phosphate dehydrogenase [Nevskiaceae bacterium]